MKYLSVCSGIEAATVAWHPLGWDPVAFSEIDKFPSAVLEHHYPSVPNWGDMTKFQEWPDETGINVLVGGTPCQSFSVSGLRQGMGDPRGSLALTYLAIAERYRPEWVVWENVPGVLSSNGGRDFGSFLGALAKLGYGWSYRILDAQYFGVPQRRRRVFVVGHLGDWRRAAAVLFERESLRGNPPPSRKEGEEATGTLGSRASSGGGFSTDFEVAGGLQPTWPAETACTLNAAFGSKQGLEDQHARGGSSLSLPNVSLCLNAGAMGRLDAESETLIPTTGAAFDVAQTLKGEDFDASEDGTGRGTPLVPMAFDTTQITHPENRSNPRPGDPCHTLPNGGHAPAIAFSCKDHGADAGDTAPTLRAMNHTGSHANAGGQVAVAWAQELADPVTANEQKTYIHEGTGNFRTRNVQATSMAVRRLTPRECERLQGFPDDYTLIPWRNKPAENCPDGPRYKALGNSMAVPVMRWIGKRINMVSEIKGAA